MRIFVYRREGIFIICITVCSRRSVCSRYPALAMLSQSLFSTCAEGSYIRSHYIYSEMDE